MSTWNMPPGVSTADIPGNEAPKRRGRPPAKDRPRSSTQRNRDRRDRLAAAGLRTVSVVLTPEAGAALDALTAGGASQSDVVSLALVDKLSTALLQSRHVAAEP